jgi:hypothetical protein
MPTQGMVRNLAKESGHNFVVKNGLKKGQEPVGKAPK